MVYRCDICGTEFQKDNDLHSHRCSNQCKACRICMYCDFQIVSPGQIRYHMETQHRTFPCDLCNRKFFLSAGRDDHRRDVHGVSTVTQSHQPVHNTKFLSDLQSTGSLNNLLTTKVRQDPTRAKRCNEIVDYLVRFLQHNTGPACAVSEVVKGGSLGKGTSIKARVDIDLVVYMNRFSSVADLQVNVKDVLKLLHDHLLKDATFAKKIHFTRYTKHSIRFSLSTDTNEDMIEVDMLPACDVGGGSSSIFKKMSGLSKEEQSFYSVSFAKDQVRFTRDRPEEVKNVIRLIKYWKTLEKLDLPSYCVEIITIKKWEDLGSPRVFELHMLFKSVMKELADLSRINITWSNDIKTSARVKPVVMDPANPTNNTADTILNVAEIERKAREMIEWI